MWRFYTSELLWHFGKGSEKAEVAICVVPQQHCAKLSMKGFWTASVAKVRKVFWMEAAYFLHSSPVKSAPCRWNCKDFLGGYNFRRMVHEASCRADLWNPSWICCVSLPRSPHSTTFTFAVAQQAHSNTCTCTKRKTRCDASSSSRFSITRLPNHVCLPPVSISMIRFSCMFGARIWLFKLKNKRRSETNGGNRVGTWCFGTHPLRCRAHTITSGPVALAPLLSVENQTSLRHRRGFLEFKTLCFPIWSWLTLPCKPAPPRHR